MQLELFPDYPRLSLDDLPPAPPDMSQAWKLFDYPTEDDEPMAQSKKQADTIVYLTSVLEAVLHNMKQDYFIGADVLVYHTRTDHVREAGKVTLKANKRINSPDVFIAIGEGLPKEEDTDSFIMETMLEHTNGKIPKMVSIEILSKSNYKNKSDQRNRFKFQNELGVDEYIVVHTKPKMSLEVYWRLGGTLQRILFCEENSYDFVMMGIRFEVEEIFKGYNKRKKPIYTYNLLVFDQEGEKFNNYGTEREIRQEAETKLETIAQKLREEQEERIAAEEEYHTAEEARLQELEARLQAEEKARQEQEARIKAESRATKAEKEAAEEKRALQEKEEELQKALFAIQEMRNLLKVQPQYKEE